MDRGRQIDNIQNSNAVFLDRFGKSGKTSTKVINPPGGKDHFSLGWEEPQQPNQSQKPQSNKPRIERKKETEPRTIPSQYHPKTQQQPQQPPQQNQNQNQPHTSVRVNQRPGGSSNIIFGTDDSNYEHYRK